VARPRNQEKRRGELLSAAHQVVARKGMADAKLRDVAAEAGITPGAVLYYFENLDGLFFAAYERAVERFCVEREEAVIAAAHPREALETVIRLGIPTSRDDTEIRLLYEFEAVAFRSPACAQLMADYVERQVDMYAGLLEAGVAAGVFDLRDDARTVARNLIALEDGHGLYVLTGQVTPAEVERMLLAGAAALVSQRAPSQE
jgi:AcrR family transcriptional regulator